MALLVNGEPYIHGLDPETDAKTFNGNNPTTDALAHQQNTDKGTTKIFFEVGLGTSLAVAGAIRRGVLFNPGGAGPYTAIAWEARNSAGQNTGAWVQCLDVRAGNVNDPANVWQPFNFEKIPANTATGQPDLNTAREGINYLLSKLSNSTPPVIGGFTPARGAIGSTVLINGNNFGTTTGSVKLGAKTCTVDGWSNFQISVRVPVGATPGRFTVTTAGGSDISRDTFTAYVTSTPGPVSNFTVVRNNDLANLAWDAPADTGNTPVTDYRVKYRLAGSISYIEYVHPVRTQTSIVIAGLDSTRDYDFLVAAINANGTGPDVQAVPGQQPGGTSISVAAQWQPGAQKEGALVYDAGLVYRVKRDIADSQTAPGANLSNYLLIGPASANSNTPAAGSLPLIEFTRDSQGGAEVMLPVGHSAAIEDYSIALRPRNPLTRFRALKEAGVVADAVIVNDGDSVTGTDNSAALKTLFDELSDGPFRAQPHTLIQLEKGKAITFKDNRNFNLRSVTLDFNGGAMMVSYAPTNGAPFDNMFSRTINRYEQRQSNVATYEGRKFYFASVYLRAARKGDRMIQAINPADIADENIYFVGAGIEPFGDEKIFRGYPMGAARFEGAKITDVSRRAEGILYIDQPLQYSYPVNLPDYTGTDGAEVGPARMFPLDNPVNPYSDYFEIANGTIYPSKKDAESIAFPAYKFLMRNFTVFGGMVISENLDWAKVWDSTIYGEVELDKGIGLIELLRSKFYQLLSNAGGAKELRMIGGYSDKSIQVGAPKVLLQRVHANAGAFATDGGTNQKPADPAIAGYPGAHFVESFTVDQITFSRKNQAAALMDIMVYVRYQITNLEEGSTTKFFAPFNRTDTSPGLVWTKTARVGTPIWTKDGVGRATVVSINYVRTDAREGYIVELKGTAPALNQEWIIPNTGRIFDKGGHLLLTSAGYLPAVPIYSPEYLRYKGSKGLNFCRPDNTLEIDYSDFARNQTQDDFFTYKFRLWADVLKVEVEMIEPATYGRMQIAILPAAENAEYYLARFDFASVGTGLMASKDGAIGLTPVTDNSVGPGQYVPANFGMAAESLNFFIQVPKNSPLPKFRLKFTRNNF